jgi:hypothetical protein
MLTIGEAGYKGKPVSVFWVTQGTESIAEVIQGIRERMQERFRCGDQPTAGHTPLVGNVAFIKTGLFGHPAALVALTNELTCMFNTICVQVSPESYVVSILKPSASAGLKLGDVIPAVEVKEHADPWTKS